MLEGKKHPFRNYRRDCRLQNHFFSPFIDKGRCERQNYFDGKRRSLCFRPYLGDTFQKPRIDRFR